MAGGSPCRLRQLLHTGAGLDAAAAALVRRTSGAAGRAARCGGPPGLATGHGAAAGHAGAPGRAGDRDGAAHGLHGQPGARCLRGRCAAGLAMAGRRLALAALPRRGHGRRARRRARAGRQPAPRRHEAGHAQPESGHPPAARSLAAPARRHPRRPLRPAARHTAAAHGPHPAGPRRQHGRGGQGRSQARQDRAVGGRARPRAARRGHSHLAARGPQAPRWPWRRRGRHRWRRPRMWIGCRRRMPCPPRTTAPSCGRSSGIRRRRGRMRVGWTELHPCTAHIPSLPETHSPNACAGMGLLHR